MLLTIDYLFKFIVIGMGGIDIGLTTGEAGGGKSCLLYHCINDTCELSSRPLMIVKQHSSHTIGVEFSSRTLRIGDRNIKLQVGCAWVKLIQLWDTAGQERFKSVTRSYYSKYPLDEADIRGCSGCTACLRHYFSAIFRQSWSLADGLSSTCFDTSSSSTRRKQARQGGRT